MFCGYVNVNDYCNNRYNYVYAHFVANNCYAVPDSGSLASVYRQDLITNEVLLLTSSNYTPLQSCDIDDDSQGFNNWDCYQSFLNNGGVVNDPPLEEYKLVQNDIIQDCYKNLIDAGILVSIDNFITNVAPYQDGAYVQVAPEDTSNYSIHLPASEEDVINFSNILSQATLLNASDSNDTITPIVDYYNVAHFLNYLNLVNILSNYFSKLKLYTTLKNNLLNDLQFASSISDIQNLTFYGYKPSSKSSVGSDLTVAGETIIQTNTLDCLDLDNIINDNEICQSNNDCYYCSDGASGGTDSIWYGESGANLCASLGGTYWFYPDTEQDGGNYGLAAGVWLRSAGPTCDCPISNNPNCAVQGICCDGNCVPDNWSFCVDPFFGPTNYANIGFVDADTNTCYQNVPAVCCNGELVPDYPGLNPCA